MNFARRDWIAIISFILLAFILAYTRMPADRVIANDGCSYAKTAQNLLRGEGYTYMGAPNVVFPPVYPLMIAAAHTVDNNLERSAFSISLISWALTMIPLYLIAILLFEGSFIGRILFMLTAALSANLNFIAGKVLSESAYILLLYTAIFLALFFIIRRKSERIVHYILIGALFALAYLTRPEGFIFALLTSLFILLFGNGILRKRLLAGAVLLITFFALSAPYLIFLKNVTGSFQLSGRAGITLIGGEHLTNKGHWLHYEKELYSLNAEGKQVFMYAGKPISMLNYTIDNFPSMIKRFFINLWSYALSILDTLFPVGLLLVAAYIFLRKPKFTNNKDIWFLLIMLLPVFASMLFFLYDRYIFPYLPIIYLFCAFGLLKLGEYVKEKFTLKPAAVIAFQVILILLFQLSVFEPYIHTREKRERPWNEVKELALWMKENIDGVEGKKIVSRKAMPAFYAEGQYRALPWVESETELYDYMDRIDADYLIVDTRYFYKLRPKIYHLIETSRKFDSLELVRVVSNKKHTAVLYRFLKQES